MPLTKQPGSGQARDGLEVAARTEEASRPGEGDHLGRRGVAQRRGVGELAGQGVVHPVCGVWPVEHDAG